MEPKKNHNFCIVCRRSKMLKSVLERNNVAKRRIELYGKST